ncbi:MAG TPA: MBG domain-containing protein, partial [Pirellulales bacterium]|nr:MBG domain-containing protein [Pirellulales bacterium]
NVNLSPPNGGSNSSYISDIAIESDDEIIAGGGTVYGGSVFALAKFPADGYGPSDPSFGDGGWSWTYTAGPINAVTLQSDGSVVVVGGGNGGHAFTVARYNKYGQLDSTFNSGIGSIRIDFGKNEVGSNAYGAALESDGKIVAVGYSNAEGPNEFAIARFTSSGAQDADFGNGGEVLTDFGTPGGAVAHAVAIQANGKLVVAGTASTGSADEFALAQYDLYSAPTITSGDSALFTTGIPSSVAVTATGYPAPTLGEVGALPDGVTFDPSTGTLAGTPAAGSGGVYAIAFTATNGVGSDAVQNYTLTVNEPANIISPDKTSFAVGTTGTFNVTAAGFPTPSFAQSGTLPDGVSFDPTTGVLSGTPAQGTGGTYPITLIARNGIGPQQQQSFTLTVDEAADITSADAATFTVGAQGSFGVAATGFPAPSVSESGTLPDGVTFDAATDSLVGTPAAGTGRTYPITFTAHNGVGADFRQAFTLTVDQAPAISSDDHATFAFGMGGSVTLSASGYPAPAFSETGSLPSGVTLTNNGNGTATLACSSSVTSGVYQFTVDTDNGVGSDDTQNFTLVVTQATPVITWSNPAAITYGETLGGTQLDATSGVPGTFSYTLGDGTTAADGAVVPAGQNQKLDVTFTPDDTVDYTTTTYQVAINVDPAPLTITAKSTRKAYGQTTTFAGTEFTTSGLVNGDGVTSVTLNSTGAAATAGVGGSPYQIIPSAAQGTGLSNYDITYGNGQLTVNAAPLTITAKSTGKTYGQTTTFAGTEFTTSGLLNGDTVTSVSLASAGAAATAGVSGSPYQIVPSKAQGTGLSNYDITYDNGQLTVNAVRLTITAKSTAKTYGQTTTFAGTEFTTSGLVNSDAVTGVTLNSMGAVATAGVSGSPYQIVPSAAQGTGLSNYDITYDNGTLTVTPATLTVKANDASRQYGHDNPTFTATIMGFVNGDGASAVSGAASLTTSATATSQLGTYTIAASAGTLSAADYTFSFQNGTLMVTTNSQGPFGTADDIYVIGSGTVAVPDTTGVLANDTGPGQLTVTTGAVTGANGGTFVFQSDGSFTYTPSAKFPGFDYAQYTAKDPQGDQASATVDVLSQTGGVVWKFYESVLGRNPDYGGLQFWTNDFTSGGKTGDIAVGFFESDELLNQILGGYYEQYLGRALDAQGLTYWKGVWHSTGGPEGIKAGFAASPEFNGNAGNTPDGWVTALYNRILNRAPDPQGFAYWEQQLAAGVSEHDIALRFFDSPEAFRNDVTGWFQEYLGRAPTDAELAQYANEMSGGMSDRDIEQQITNLPEYAANPPAPPTGTATRLPDYFQASSAGSQPQAVVAAKDAVFSQLK